MRLARLYLMPSTDALIVFTSWLVAIISAAAVIGHASGQLWMAQWLTPPPMAMSTAVCNLLVSVCLMALHRRERGNE